MPLRGWQGWRDRERALRLAGPAVFFERLNCAMRAPIGGMDLRVFLAFLMLLRRSETEWIGFSSAVFRAEYGGSQATFSRAIKKLLSLHILECRIGPDLKRAYRVHPDFDKARTSFSPCGCGNPHGV